MLHAHECEGVGLEREGKVGVPFVRLDGRWVNYIYDFGDDWHHVIRVEKIDEAMPGAD